MNQYSMEMLARERIAGWMTEARREGRAHAAPVDPTKARLVVPLSRIVGPVRRMLHRMAPAT